MKFKLSKEQIEQRNAIHIANVTGRMDSLPAEIRALSAVNPNGGGVLISESMEKKIELALRNSGGIFSVATIRPTLKGGRHMAATMNDIVAGEILSENTDMGLSEDPSVGIVVYDTVIYSSKPVVCSNELLQDINDLEEFEETMSQMLAERIRRASQPHFNSGNGVGKPLGFLHGGVKGEDCLADFVTYNNIENLYESVHPDYRAKGSWMVHDNTKKVLRNLVDNNGNQIFFDAKSSGQNPFLLGKPVIINNDMPVIGAGNKSIAFGDFSKYKIRIVEPYFLTKIKERYAENNQSAYIMFVRMDGKILDAGTNPIKYLQHALL
jgi:HK97 family phage major capsid protein